MSHTVGQALSNAREALKTVSKEEAAFEARLLACFALSIQPEALLLQADAPVDDAALKRLEALIARRNSNEPLQYILGEWEFMGLPFFVSPEALIPRQDTETLTEHALTLIKERGYKSALDLCCGTGCIGISLSKLGGVTATLADISEGCISLAQKNAARNGVEATFIQGDLFESIMGRFDLICSNPPYIPASELDALQSEVKKEPRLALDGGEDGLVFYRRIAQGYKAHLHEGGMLLLEVGIHQAPDVCALFESAYTVRDLNGVERVVAVRG